MVTKEEILNDVKKVIDDKNKSMRYYAKHGKYNQRHIQKFFGSWNTVLELLGYKPSRTNIQDIDLTGEKFNMITVIRKLDEKDKNSRVLWECECGYCGKKFKTTARSLINYKIESCGCVRLKYLNHDNHTSESYRKNIDNRNKGYKEDGTYIYKFNRNKKSSNNTSGYTGVTSYMLKSGVKYKAVITVRGKVYTKSGFLSAEDAYKYRLKMEDELLSDNFKEKQKEYLENKNKNTEK